jgi:hypothetical protein
MLEGLNGDINWAFTLGAFLGFCIGVLVTAFLAAYRRNR